MATNYFITLAKGSCDKTVISSGSAGSTGSTGSVVPRSAVPHISLTQGDDWNVKCTNLAIKILFPYKGGDAWLKHFQTELILTLFPQEILLDQGPFISINNPYVTESWN